nr:PREDICTED: probable calcium-binding protein CML30 [Musa acuminata subsp. malaccensis]
MVLHRPVSFVDVPSFLTRPSLLQLPPSFLVSLHSQTLLDSLTNHTFSRTAITTVCIYTGRFVFFVRPNNIVFFFFFVPPLPPPMEKPSTTAPYQSLALTEPIVLLFYKTVSIWFLLLQKISLQLVVFLRSRDEFPAPCASRIDEHAGKGASGDCGDALELTREDVEAVMEAMGIHRGSDGGDQLRERIAGAELSGLFEGEEPSLEEVEAAFAVFDDDRDGFIDAAELQRVLPKLGFREGLALEACRQMIAAYDENQDGRIDFDEFVKFMENSFC